MKTPAKNSTKLKAGRITRQSLLGVAQTLFAALMMVLICPTAFAVDTEGENFDAATGYRIAHYRAALPDKVPGGQRLDTEEVEKVFKARRAVFIDVMPSTGAGFDPKSGKWRLTKKRKNIPGSTWLPDVGHGNLKPTLKRYFEQNLDLLSGGDKSKPLLFYCQSDCWMAWNAVKRASALGYQNLYWYPDGTDGWREWDNPVEPATPIPVDVTTRQTATSGQQHSQAADPLAGHKTIFLIDQAGKAIPIGSVDFIKKENSSAFTVKIASDRLQEKFLSMRPFRCLDGKKQTVCHLPYPYPLADTVTRADLTDLEYRLLFLHKAPTDYGIDAWNGLYYKLAINSAGTIDGTLHEADFNILAVPPGPGETRPIKQSDLQEAEPARHRFPRLEIR